MSRYSGPKFKLSVTDQLRAAWTRLPWPSPGKGETDGNQAIFRSYGTGVTRVSPYPDPGLTREDIDTSELDQSYTQNISFAILGVNNQRRMALSPLLIGPAIIESADFECNPVAGNSNAVFSIFIAETPELITTITPRPSGQDIFPTQAISAGVLAPDDITGILLTGQGAPRLTLSHNFDVLVPLDRFFLKPSICQTLGAQISVTGYIRVRQLHHGISLTGKRAYRS